MKKILFILFGLILVPAVALAAFNDVTVSGSADILLPDNGLTYTLTNATRVESFTVNNANIEFVMQDNSIVELMSTDASKFTLSSGCEVLASSCTATLSSISVQCRTSVTLTVTPGAASTCTGSGGGGSSGGGSSGGGSTTTPTPDTGTVDVTLNINSPFALVLPSASHTVMVKNATDAVVSLTISPKPINLSLNKNETKDVDTDGDGWTDLRVTYYGFSPSSLKPKLKFVELSASDMTAVTAIEQTQGAGVCGLQVGEAFKHANSASVYYVTKDCKKRAFNNSRVFFTYFDSWADVNVVPKTSLDDLSDDDLGFMPWGSKYDPKYGALVKVVTDPKVYLLLGTEKYWITDEDVFNALSYKWNWIEDVDDALLDKYTTGTEINYTDRHPNFTLIKYADSPRVYKLENDKKRHIVNETAFENLGYRWDRIVTVEDSEEYLDGEELSAD
ncbi:MAG: hypothetical protein Q8P20_04105 [bacterium]|nr:hypothetical protein [bacterium]